MAKAVSESRTAAGKPHIRLRGSDFALGQLLIPKGTKVTPPVAVSAAAADHHRTFRIAAPARFSSSRPATRLLRRAPAGKRIRHPGQPERCDRAALPFRRSNGGIEASGSRTTRTSIARAVRIRIGRYHRRSRRRIARRSGPWPRRSSSGSASESLSADVAMKPGKPVWYGKVGARHVLGLLAIPPRPSRPPACSLTSNHPSSGRKGCRRPALAAAPALEPIEANGPREAFLCAATSFRGVEVSDRQEASGQARRAEVNALVRAAGQCPAGPSRHPVPTLPLCC